MKRFLTAMTLMAAMTVSTAMAAQCPSQCPKKAACKCEACGCTAEAKKAGCTCDKCACGKKAECPKAAACPKQQGACSK
jgi:hypothetical protein